MAHKIYDNFYLSNEVEDQFNSHLDLQTFCNVDNSLVGTPGMIRKINRYKATDGTEKLGMGEGNTKSIEVSYTDRSYTIQLAQNRFQYYDEQEMTDPMLVPTGVRHMGTDMFNTVNADIYAEFNKATLNVVTSTFDFDCFANAQSLLNLENLESKTTFAFVHPSDVAAIRKSAKETLQYVTAFAVNGYVGTIAGTNIYTKKDAIPGTIIMATRDAVTIFNKKGVEVEQPQRDSEDANVRLNTIISRKYYLVALTDERYAVKIVKGTAAASNDTTVSSEKAYYKPAGLGYVLGTPTANPKTEGFFEITIS